MKTTAGQALHAIDQLTAALEQTAVYGNANWLAANEISIQAQAGYRTGDFAEAYQAAAKGLELLDQPVKTAKLRTVSGPAKVAWYNKLGIQVAALVLLLPALAGAFIYVTASDQPASHSPDAWHAMTAAEVRQRAGLSEEYTFFEGSDQSLAADLPAGHMAWITPWQLTHYQNVWWINPRATPLMVGYEAQGQSHYGPLGTAQVLLIRATSGLQAVHFPSSCGPSRGTGSADRLPDHATAVFPVKVVRGICAYPSY